MPIAARTLVDVAVTRASQTPDQSAFRFLTDATGEGTPITYSELDRRARAVAAVLQDAGATGERVLVVLPPGIDFIVSFIGTLYAGAAAVPLAPLYPGRIDRAQSHLGAVVQDASPVAVLTTSSLTGTIAELKERFPGWDRVRILAADALDELPEAWRAPQMDEGTIGLIQYTSGSTSMPRGVMVTHGNLLHNAEAISRDFPLGPGDQGVLWLPPHHDMGLIGGIVEPLYAGFEMGLMSPLMLLQRPLRWVQAVSRWKATVSGAPNFAYELAVSRTTPEQRAALDLSNWSVAFTGAEPIRASTLERFAEAFAPAGFRREALHPCYGLAEGTLIVTGVEKNPVTVYDADAEALEARRVRPAGPDSAQVRRLVGCGRAVYLERVVIVDPETREACSDGEIGEVWVHGPSVARGYWNRPEETERTFRARIAGTNDGPYLRTGDLGFLRDGELFVTGRLKDLIIIDGRNHYPQDIEATAEASHPAVRPAGTAAFPVDDGGRERLVLFAEVDRARLRGARVGEGAEPAGTTDIIEAIRRSVAEGHGVPVHDVVLVPPGGVPRTTSGKIQRHKCRQAYESRAIEAGVGQ